MDGQTTVLDAVQKNDLLGSLIALRDVLAFRIDNDISGRDLAPTANALKDVLETIEMIQSADGDPETDSIVNSINEQLTEMGGNVVNLH